MANGIWLPLYVNFWVLVATCANAFTFAGVLGWKDSFGVAGTPTAAAVVVVAVSVIGIFKAVLRSDLVVCWALAGVYRMQTGSDPDAFPEGALDRQLALVAIWCSSVTFLASLVGLFLGDNNGALQGLKGVTVAKPLATGRTFCDSCILHVLRNRKPVHTAVPYWMRKVARAKQHRVCILVRLQGGDEEKRALSTRVARLCSAKSVLLCSRQAFAGDYEFEATSWAFGQVRKVPQLATGHTPEVTRRGFFDRLMTALQKAPVCIEVDEALEPLKPVLFSNHDHAACPEFAEVKAPSAAGELTAILALSCNRNQREVLLAAFQVLGGKDEARHQVAGDQYIVNDV
eukprot:g3568.t1